MKLRSSQKCAAENRLCSSASHCRLRIGPRRLPCLSQLETTAGLMWHLASPVPGAAGSTVRPTPLVAHTPLISACSGMNLGQSGARNSRDQTGRRCPFVAPNKPSTRSRLFLSCRRLRTFSSRFAEPFTTPKAESGDSSQTAVPETRPWLVSLTHVSLVLWLRDDSHQVRVDVLVDNRNAAGDEDGYMRIVGMQRPCSS